MTPFGFDSPADAHRLRVQFLRLYPAARAVKLIGAGGRYDWAAYVPPGTDPAAIPAEYAGRRVRVFAYDAAAPFFRMMAAEFRRIREEAEGDDDDRSADAS